MDNVIGYCFIYQESLLGPNGHIYIHSWDSKSFLVLGFILNVEKINNLTENFLRNFKHSDDCKKNIHLKISIKKL